MGVVVYRPRRFIRPIIPTSVCRLGADAIRPSQYASGAADLGDDYPHVNESRFF